MTVDLTPIITPLLSLAGLGVSAFGMYALQRVAAKFNIQISSTQLNNLNASLIKAIAAGGMAAESMAAVKGWDHPDVKNAVVAGALQFLADHADVALKQAGLDPVANASTITAHLQALLPTALPAVAASPVTTNGPPPVPPRPITPLIVEPINVPVPPVPPSITP
jgi:hypothetical protein